MQIMDTLIPAPGAPLAAIAVAFPGNGPEFAAVLAATVAAPELTAATSLVAPADVARSNDELPPEEGEVTDPTSPDETSDGKIYTEVVLTGQGFTALQDASDGPHNPLIAAASFAPEHEKEAAPADIWRDEEVDLPHRHADNAPPRNRLGDDFSRTRSQQMQGADGFVTAVIPPSDAVQPEIRVAPKHDVTPHDVPAQDLPSHAVARPGMIEGDAIVAGDAQIPSTATEKSAMHNETPPSPESVVRSRAVDQPAAAQPPQPSRSAAAPAPGRNSSPAVVVAARQFVKDDTSAAPKGTQGIAPPIIGRTPPEPSLFAQAPMQSTVSDERTKMPAPVTHVLTSGLTKNSNQDTQATQGAVPNPTGLSQHQLEQPLQAGNRMAEAGLPQQPSVPPLQVTTASPAPPQNLADLAAPALSKGVKGDDGPQRREPSVSFTDPRQPTASPDFGKQYQFLDRPTGDGSSEPENALMEYRAPASMADKPSLPSAASHQDIPVASVDPRTETRQTLAAAGETDRHVLRHHAEPHRQIADAIVRTRDGTLEVLLDPVELGRVTVMLGTDAHAGRLGILVERPETLDLIRRHADDLLRDLRDNGMPDAHMDFLRQDGMGGQNHGQQMRDRTDAVKRREVVPDVPNPQLSAADKMPLPVSGGRIDIRL